MSEQRVTWTSHRALAVTRLRTPLPSRDSRRRVADGGEPCRPNPPPAAEPIRGCLIPALPDDIAVHCIALLPRAVHPSLALVSRAFRCLLCRHPGPLLAARRHLGLSDSHILLSPPPTLLHIPPLLPPPPASRVAASSHPFSPHPRLVHPRRSWSAGPRLSSPREFAAAVVQSGTLFVAGGCVPSSPFWAEALDLSSPDAKWDPIASPPHLREKWMHGWVSLAGKVLAVADRGGLSYDPAAPPSEAWAPVSPVLDMGWKGRAAVVGDILYSYDYLGKVKGYDPDTYSWSTVEGLEKELPKFLSGATLANVGGLLYLVWEGKWKGKGKGAGEVRSMVVIEWAGIEVRRDEEGRLRGKVVSRDTVVFPDAPRGSAITHCIAVEL
ncbi:hypothetical protein PR202_ga28822 [Eleusine coracana subsp. coracana]|uniref:FKB95-like N-terminal Kelch domain-containing protein n=1 Tax=Eleusine coracana subsp. coracana TaxID=191504 RepID=A0AAV5DLB6_ELECO|nr:hypothetical protein PR202_ga28822 [Eleusine coracana subsp. coracana]